MKSTAAILALALASSATASATTVGDVTVPEPLANVMALENDARDVRSVEFFPALGDDAGVQTLAERAGVTLINFWATWCAPCKVEMPHLEAAAEQLADEGLEVLAISLDNSEAAARAFMVENGYDDLELLFDRRMGSFRALGGRGVPYTALIDDQGRLVASLSGIRDWSDAETLDFLRLFLQGDS